MRITPPAYNRTILLLAPLIVLVLPYTNRQYLAWTPFPVELSVVLTTIVSASLYLIGRSNPNVERRRNLVTDLSILLIAILLSIPVLLTPQTTDPNTYTLYYTANPLYLIPPFAFVIVNLFAPTYIQAKLQRITLILGGVLLGAAVLFVMFYVLFLVTHPFYYLHPV